jgi:tRNA (guanine37-N1)-methyltransferase
MQFEIITIFPEMFAALEFGIVGRAQKKNLIQTNCLNPRDFCADPDRRVDDTPYGGGPGMVMMVDPLLKTIRKAKEKLPDGKVIYLSPQGRPLTQEKTNELSQKEALIFVCGRYEGIDERLIELAVDEEISIGDYVLSGGELAAMVLIDAITRLLPGATGDQDSIIQDSFVDNLLDYPHYTRPREIAGKKVPEILLTGDHQAIYRWRLKQALARTWLRRKDLLEKRKLSLLEKELLNEFLTENNIEADHDSSDC